MLTGVTMRLLRHPFGLAADGTVATVEQGSDQFLDQCIQVTVGTVVGEREMCMPFGVPDPVWHGLEASDIAASLTQFGPPNVVINSVDTTWLTETSARLTVNWDRVDLDSVGSDQP